MYGTQITVFPMYLATMHNLASCIVNSPFIPASTLQLYKVQNSSYILHTSSTLKANSYFHAARSTQHGTSSTELGARIISIHTSTYRSCVCNAHDQKAYIVFYGKVKICSTLDFHPCSVFRVACRFICAPCRVLRSACSVQV